MARQQRKELADLRAMEEEHARMEMHGSGKHFVGAGATPSMGLSQFRGGAKKGKKAVHYDEDMEGGRIGLLTGFTRARPTSTAIVPYRPPSGALTQFGRTNLARPSLPPSYYQNLFRRPTTGAVARPSLGSRVQGALGAVGRNITASRIAQALSMGIPLAMLGSYLADTAGADGDAGYYDDYAGDDFGPSGGPSDGGPTDGGPYGPSQPYPEVPIDYPTDGPSGGVPSDLSPAELAWYLQSGNLPERYALRQKTSRRRGKGKLTITHGEEEMEGSGRRQASKKHDGRSARAEIVRRVMRERGVKLAEASRIVKAEGLY
jgi:hypothetical protein